MTYLPKTIDMGDIKLSCDMQELTELLAENIEKILDHSNIGITMNLYVHITEEEKLKEINMVAKALNLIFA